MIDDQVCLFFRLLTILDSSLLLFKDLVRERIRAIRDDISPSRWARSHCSELPAFEHQTGS